VTAPPTPIPRADGGQFDGRRSRQGRNNSSQHGTEDNRTVFVDQDKAPTLFPLLGP